MVILGFCYELYNKDTRQIEQILIRHTDYGMSFREDFPRIFWVCSSPESKSIEAEVATQNQDLSAEAFKGNKSSPGGRRRCISSYYEKYTWTGKVAT